MDEISLLRRTRTDVPERTPEAVARGRAALFRAMEVESPLSPAGDADAVPDRLGRRTPSWARFSALGATAVTVGVVTTIAIGIAGGPGANTPAAASVLETAAIATLTFRDPVIAPDQYLLVHTDAVYAASGSVEIDGPVASVLESYQDELYVPADRGDDWIWMQCTRDTLQTFGPQSEAFSAWLEADAAKHDAHTFRVLPGGAVLSGDERPDRLVFGYSDGTTVSRDDYGALLLDPPDLLDKIYGFTDGAGRSREGEALDWIAETLKSGTVPAEVRAALFQAAALIPGVSVTDAQATLDGRSGIAIGRLETADDTRQELIIDPDTGQYIGEREVTLGSYNGMPPGTTIASSVVTTSVVDAAPADAGICGG